MATTDLHARLLPYCYAQDRPLPSVGLARTATLIRTARAEAENALLLDNGDFLEGDLLGERQRLGGRGPLAACHPVIAAMNLAGYDAATIGNHDFSFGVEFLARAIGGASFPVVSANALRHRGADPHGDHPFLPPVALLRRRLVNRAGQEAAIAVGVIGLLPPQVEQWERRALAGRIVTRDILETACHWVPRLREMGADLVVALCHSGIGDGAARPGLENAAVPLAALPGIDAVIAGHTHGLFPSPDAGIPPGLDPAIDPVRGSLHGKPAVMAGHWGSHLGLIDLTLDRAADGWRVTGFATSLRAIAAPAAGYRIRALVATDPGLRSLLRQSHRDTLRAIRRPVGHSPRPLHSYFARIEPSAALSLIHAAQLSWLDRAAQGGPHAHLPRVSAASPVKSGGRGGPAFFTDIPAGELALRHISDLYAFPNTACAVLATGATLRNWLERSAAQFARLTAGVTDQPLFDPAMPAYNFDTIAGLSYAIDLMAAPRFAADGQPLPGAEGRIRDLAFDGAPLDDATTFLVATNNYRATGGGGFPGLGSGAPAIDSAACLRDILHAHIAAGGAAGPAAAAPSWRLLPLPPGTAAWFDTGPAATAHLHELTETPARPLGSAAEGFLRCRIGG
ncbi:MAG: bifunctional 2',3'-cyclic-nucleotide 2'-phosphodiesterase/3'-nucleotidase [Proteobacteria bacterium]|nr:bifunctional 2',3'-cyclic-nucleotide 2'-phosphodiesterase/3'-nucleotidase [Pseudomonadota bacterium]